MTKKKKKEKKREETEKLTNKAISPCLQCPEDHRKRKRKCRIGFIIEFYLQKTIYIRVAKFNENYDSFALFNKSYLDLVRSSLILTPSLF